MSEHWIIARIKQKGDCKCIHWRNLRDLILAHPDTKKSADIFALSVYNLVDFPKALGYVDEAVLICSIDSIKGSHLSQQSWPKLSDH
ncbi:hypothetical protein Gotri_000079 [Gossypium trilobum]|uniref:Uncharacterized protein n=1 Tax=Gossypium trilobum TaxID=34281 RepID=A0A7J9FU02_9ROSI|nr:hypothetical protein [Gossypium trilobum]